jgi:hypothetical protein
MEVRDGFIIGVFNYCDRWCATCRFTSRCGLFADVAEIEAAQDSNMRPVVDAPPHSSQVEPPPPAWLQELIDEMNEAARDSATLPSTEDLAGTSPRGHRAIEARARGYAHRTYQWLQAHDAYGVNDPTDPRAVIGWFHISISSKIFRALSGLADGLHEVGIPADHDGSAKVALLAIERSHAAWLQMVESGLASTPTVEAFISDLVWLTDALDRVFPRARAFVRPGFDEPDEVAKLLASE